MEKIDKNTILTEILKIPGAEEVLMKYNLPCLTCPMAAQEIGILKIGEVCKNYGIDAEKLIKELNAIYPVKR